MSTGAGARRVGRRAGPALGSRRNQPGHMVSPAGGHAGRIGRDRAIATINGYGPVSRQQPGADRQHRGRDVLQWRHDPDR